MTDQGSGRNQRKLRNFLVKPRYQFKISALFILSQFCFFSVIMAAVFHHFTSLRQVVAQNASNYFAFSPSIDDLYISTMYWIVAGFVVTGAFTILYAVIVTHRVMGPAQVIMTKVEEMKNGDFSSQRKLRPYDELSPILEGLNDLSEKMKA